MKSFKKIVVELLKMSYLKRKSLLNVRNNVENEIVIIPDTSVKKQKQTFEKPTFKR